MIVVALTKEEKEDVRRRARERGLTISEYVREVLFTYSLPISPRRKPRAQEEFELLVKAIEEEIKGKVRFLDNDVIEIEPW
jgi:KaiC/GvpD/RAD55 family RecA-like ATPase